MNYVPSCMWDELCLLLATDKGLHDEMNTVCDILQGDSPDEASDTASPSKAQHGFHSTTPPATPTLRPTKPRKRPHFDVRQRQEMILLRREVDILRKHLSGSQTKVKRPLEMTKWEKAAKSECMEKNRSIQENEQLKEAVHQQATLIQQMEKLCNKKMRLTDDAEAWQNYRLAAHESLRVAAIHAIADRQYRRMQNAFIQAGVFGCTKDLFRARVTQQDSKYVVMELANHVTLRAPFRVVSSAAWRIIGGPDAYMMTQGSIETTDFVDRHTVYSRAMLNQPDGTAVHSNIIRKRYIIEEDREVIVSRSVLEDELVPHMSKGAVDNKCLWFEVEPLPSHPTTHCSLTCVVQMTIDPTAALNVPAIDVQTALETFMQQMSLTVDTYEPKTGTFHIATKSLEHLAVPHPIHHQLDRGRIFLTALEDEINRAVRLDNHLPLTS
ncbi:unnamed protein product [Aphanomyces euteiches]